MAQSIYSNNHFLEILKPWFIDHPKVAKFFWVGKCFCFSGQIVFCGNFFLVAEFCWGTKKFLGGQIYGMANYSSGPIYYWLNISVLKSHIDWRSEYCLVQFVWKIKTLQLRKFFLEEWVWEKNHSKKKDPDDALCSNFENNPSQQLKRYRSRNLSLFLPCKNKKRNKEPAGGLDLYFHPCFEP